MCAALLLLLLPLISPSLRRGVTNVRDSVLLLRGFIIFLYASWIFLEVLCSLALRIYIYTSDDSASWYIRAAI